MDAISFYKNVFRNIITSTCIRASKEVFLGIKDISRSQQFEIIFKKFTCERSIN